MLVVAAAIIAGNRLLAAQRARPPELGESVPVAGPATWGWELPGGKVEPGEAGEDALVRECREELGVAIAVGRRVGGDWPLSPGTVMRVWTATITKGEPEPREHAALRWLTAGELFDVPWLPADLPVVEAVRHYLEEAR